MNPQNKNLIDSNTNTFFTTSTLSENFSTNEFIQLRLANPVTYSQLQSIMFYNIDPAHSSTFNGAKFKLIDSSLNTFYEYVIEDSATANIYRFDGPAIKSWPYNYLSSNTVFNKVRLMRTSLAVSGYSIMNLQELQIWTMSNGVLTNIALLGTFSANALHNDNNDYSAQKLTDGLFNNTYTFATIHDYDLDDWVYAEFSSNYDINNLASIVIYNRNDGINFDKMIGISVQLMYDDNIIYSEEINTANMVYRVDGPAFSSVTGSMMSMQPSTTLIYNGHEVIDASTVTNGNINTTFSKVRVIRTGESGFNDSYSGNRLSINEIQLWIENNGMIENVLSGIVASDYTTQHSSTYNISLATNGDFHTDNGITSGNEWGYITINGTNGSISGSGTLGQYATFVLTTPRNIQDIASIVYGSVVY